MYVLGELFRALAMLVSGVCTLLYWFLFARIILSWFPVDPYHSIVQFLYQVTDPLLAPFRRLPLQIGMLDLSPIFAFIALVFIRNVTVRFLVELAYRFGAQ
ncbi:MAG: YggT family protein [Candidatus Omnitrophota bacterium]